MPHRIFTTAIGDCAVAWRQRGLTRLWLPEATRATLESQIQQAKAGTSAPLPPWCAKAVERIQRHCEDGYGALQRVPIDLEGLSPFRQNVYSALRQVRRGSTLSYTQLAERAGHPGAQRAIGTAMAQNPLPLVVPCHRVLSSTGSGGFSAHGGLETKAQLLAKEGVCLRPQEVFDYDIAKARRVLRKSSRAMAQLVDRVGAFRMQPSASASTEESLARAIVFQQLTAAAASSIYRRLVAQLGGKLDAKKIAEQSPAQLRSAGLSKNKVLAIKALAQRSLAAEVPSLLALSQRSNESVVAELSQFRGIGRWSVEMLLMFRLGRSDVMPLGDYGVRKGFGRSHGIAKPSRFQLREAAETWRPYRSVASWYLWRANDGDG